MKKRILGIDIGTNSLGWAIVDYDPDLPGDKYQLVDRGVNIFQEGVKIEKGNESSRAAERTGYKHQRTGYWRRKVRKIKLLTILMKYGLCPELTPDELRNWRTKKIYPKASEFINWLRTEDTINKNPYYYRNLCLSGRLDWSSKADRYKIGRAIYHINQRRGFLSNRREETKASDGAVAQSISQINLDMAASGHQYLGQYLYSLYERGEKIRTKYTDRIEHYEKELLAICQIQGLSDELTRELREVIITQRPLKSQKHTAGHCVFEKNKFRCHVSHPLFEQFRLFSFINNIKVQTPDDDQLRPLTVEEKALIIPLFLRKSKKTFNFDEIAKKISGTRNNYCFYKDKADKAYRFNYQMDTSVSGCPVIAQLSAVFDVKNDVDEWLTIASQKYVKAPEKTKLQIMNDIWHALYFFEDEAKLKEFASVQLGLDEEHALMFAAIRLPQEYGRLSLKAIRKILPYMKYYGIIYSNAAFLANIGYALGMNDGDELMPMLSEEDATDLVRVMACYDQDRDSRITKDDYLKYYLTHKYGLEEAAQEKLSCLYHPSMIETFPKVRHTNAYGYMQLGSPRTDSVRNPMAMHSLFRLRHVVNTLLGKGKIDENTTIKIEFARDLNDSNMRAALHRWQRENEARRNEARVKIREIKGGDFEPSDRDVLKYILWEDQGHICPYTGDNIGLSDLFGNQMYDIEHTIPRSLGGDSTEANLTICQSKYNRETKRAKLPSELIDYEYIMERIDIWREKYEELDKQIRKLNTRSVSDPAKRAAIIQKKHILTLRRNYWRDKYSRFTMTDVPEGFSRRQGVDVSVISRYARLYLKTLFHDVKIVKGVTTAEFRKIWGIQNEYTKKERVNHCHHAIDAITIACIGANEYNLLAQYYHDEERHYWGLDSKRAVFAKPWSTFTEDVITLSDSVIVHHHTRENMGKQTRKKIRGTANQYAQGDTVRGSLHKDTIYGAIKVNDTVNYVVRRNLDDLSEKDIDIIVDPAVREIVRVAQKKYGSLAKALEAGIWMNEEKRIPIKKVRCFASKIRRPIALRKHRDESSHEHKQHQYVANDANYMMGIYVGKDAKGKERRDFILLNNLDAAKAFNSKTGGSVAMLPATSHRGFPLQWIIKPGAMVILYEKDNPVIGETPKPDLVKALYKITGLSSQAEKGNVYGTITMTHSQEARPSTGITIKKGAYINGEDYRPAISMLHTQFKALVEGYDFVIDEDGEIRPM